MQNCSVEEAGQAAAVSLTILNWTLESLLPLYLIHGVEGTVMR